jgi:hypothetical protein
MNSIPTYNIEITNTDYFYMMENQIRKHIKKYETEICLPKAKMLLEKSNIDIKELVEYPTEGYYYETDDLKLYFKIIRNIQTNEPLWKRFILCDELTFLKNKCDNDLFGIVDPLGRNPNAPIKRRYDILTLTMENTSVFPDHDKSHRPWTIDRIMNGLGTMYNNRTNLVELAYLIKNPECLCCGAETNSLCRMIACLTGSYSMASSYREPNYIWKVDPEVESLGKRIAVAYNYLMENDLIVAPSLTNHLLLNKTPKLPRVAILGYVVGTKEYYHWILPDFGVMRELYSKEIITTESYVNKVNSGCSGNIFNAIPV